MDLKLEKCPLCGNSSTESNLEVKDYLVSGKAYILEKCSSCAFLFTNPRPPETEAAKYYDSNEYVSHTNQGYGLKNIIYRAARNFMLHKKQTWLQQFTKTKGNVLDYGCGTGNFVSFMQKNGWSSWGMEPNANARASIPAEISGRVFQDLEQLPVASFDFITLWHVFEHVYHIDETLDQLVKRLVNSGYLLIAMPNHASRDAQYYRQYWAGYDVPRHLSHFTPDTMKILVKKHRLQMVQTIPLKLDAYYISMLSETYRAGSFINGIVQGFKSNYQAKRNHLNYSSLVYVLKK